MSEPKCWMCQHHQKVKVSDEPLHFASICEDEHEFGEVCLGFERIEENVSTEG